jgi:hypothetical protein
MIRRGERLASTGKHEVTDGSTRSHERIAALAASSALACCASFILTACATNGTKPNDLGTRASGAQQPTAGGPRTAAAGAGVALDPIGNDNPGLVPTMTAAPAADSGSAPADGCVGTKATAPPASNPRVDIIWVVDASGSMLDEQMKIGANLLEFADEITMAQLDVHIVMLTTSAAIPVICPDTPADPLSGSPLATDPRYKFIDSVVDSHNALDIAQGSFAMYSSFLRPDAATHFVIVSDDESTYHDQPTPDGRASSFQMDMQAALGKPFFLHAIASEGPTACRDPNCMPDTSTGICAFVMLGCGAAAPGSTYYMLANATHGLTASICESDWGSIFKPLSAAVIQSAPLPCSYQIPPPPSGETLDASKVNVRYMAPTVTSDTLLPRAANGGACGDQLGWYYDDASAPKQINLCPHSCQTGAAGGTLSISFGCTTIDLQ